MNSDQHDMDELMGQLDNAKLAVERAQEDKTGLAEAQQHVKQAEESLSAAKHNPSINTDTNSQQLQKATDLLRLIEETNNSNNK